MTGTNDLTAAEHIQVVDALLRFAAGADNADIQLLESAFISGAEIDFSPCGKSLGLEFGVLAGRSNIVQFLQSTAASQITSHVVSNARAERKGEQAGLLTLVDAVHLTREKKPERFRMMNGYSAELQHEDETWKIAKMQITNIWFKGDPRTLLFRKETHAPGA